MSILRNKLKDRFVQVPNALVTDTSISIPARLIYVYLASKPDGWVVRNDDVKKAIGIKDDSTIAKVWKELITAGWITRKKCLPGTNAGTYEYEILDSPKYGKNPNMENSQIWENPKFGKNPDYNNTDSLSNTDLFNNKDNNPSNPLEGDETEDFSETSNKAPVNITAELKRRINTLYNRRESTTWTNKEMTVLRQIAKRNGVLDEMAVIERLYNSGYEYRRRGVQTFLNNWTSELDRANIYTQNTRQPQRLTVNDPDYWKTRATYPGDEDAGKEFTNGF